jgi:GntR family transcriptional regulator
VTDTRERAPLAERTAGRIRELIRDGELRPGSKLPSEPDMARLLGVSRATVRAAFSELTAQLVLERRRGVGTFVRPTTPMMSHGLERLIGTGDSIRQLGMEPSSRDVEVAHQLASVRQEQDLGLAEGTPVVAISRTRTANGRPVLYCREWVREAALPSPDALDDFGEDESLYARLEENGIELTTAVTTVLPVLPSREVTARLEVDPKAPILLLRQQHFAHTGDEHPVLHTENFYNSHLIELHTIRRR